MPDLFIAHNTPTNPIPTPTNPHTQSSNSRPPTNNAKPVHHIHPFATFCETPTDITFQNQERDEKIVLLVRRHLFTNIPWIIIALFFAIIPVFTPFFLQITQLPGFEISFRYIFIFLTFYYTLILGYTLVQFLSWFYNVGIVSTKRVVDIDYLHITYKNVTATEIGAVVDVEYHQGGFIRTFFNFGDVLVQTAGIRQNIDFHSVPNPAKVADIILDTKEAAKNAI